MMKRIVHLFVVAAAGLVCILPWGVQPARPADSAPSPDSPFDGQWSLEFGAATKPGGIVLNVAGCSITINMVFQAVKNSFEADKKGSFSWEEHENGLFHSDQLIVDGLGQTSHPGETQEPFLRAHGQVVDKESLALKLTLEWIGGNGQFFDGKGGGTVSVPASGTPTTFTGIVTSSIPLPLTNSVWKLKPTSIEKQDIGPDEQREVVTYKERRQTKLPWMSGQSVTEHIEIIWVRQLKLVPRG